jgi:hypothetical protein
MRFIHVGASLLAISSPTNSIASKLAPTNAGGMASIQGVGRVQPALFYTPRLLFACPAAGCTRPTFSMRSSLQ